MNFINRLRYGTVAQDQDEAATREYREAKKKDYAGEGGDHDYGKSSIPEKYNITLREKGKGKYWTAKQYLKEKLGVGEDVFSVAEDEAIDLCVHRARHTQKQAMKLSMVLLKYQKVIQLLTSKETGLGLLLKAYGESDASAGMPGSDDVLDLGVEEVVKPCRTLMCKLGDALQGDALMLSEMDMPIAKLFREVETFRGKALLDCLRAVSELNEKKQRFRGALLWMTDAANSLSDPDAKKELNNFREAQYMVKVCKLEFEQACTKVQSKTELLLSSLNNLFALHLPGYVFALGNQLKSSETAYSDIYKWSRETMFHQYRRAADIQRERAVDQVIELEGDAFANSSSAIQFEDWANESNSPMPEREAEGKNVDGEDDRDLDWLLDDEDDDAKKCEKIQDLLLELSNDQQESVQDMMKESSEQREMILDCSMAENSDMLCDGEIKKITADEGSMEDFLPMSKVTMERQKREVEREEQIGRQLDDLLAGLEFNISISPAEESAQQEQQSGPDMTGSTALDSSGAQKKPLSIKSSNDSDEESNKERLDGVQNIWAALEANFSAAAMAKEALEIESPPADSGEHSDGARRPAQPPNQHKNLLKWFSRSKSDSQPPTAGGQLDAASAADAGAGSARSESTSQKFSSLFDKLEPDADERALQGLLNRDENEEESSGFALM